MRSLILLSLLATLISVILAQQEEVWPPSFCNGKECPKFTVLTKTADYEIRRYEPTTWVATTMSSRSGTLAMTWMFRRLYKYITGANKDGLNINMTVPVVTIMPNDQDRNAWEVQNYTMGFYLPNNNPPKPTNSKVFINKDLATTYYVKSFSGYYYAAFQYKPRIRELKQAIGDDSLYKTDRWYVLSYQSPFKMSDRYNEVLLKKN